MHPWEWSKRPLACVHIDHLGPFQGKTILVVVDAYSKWIESVIVPLTSSQATIKALRNMFATHGIPETIVSDNGSGFTSCELGDFTRKNGIQHIKTAPYHPASNGLAERAIQTTVYRVNFVAQKISQVVCDCEILLCEFFFYIENFCVLNFKVMK